MSGCFVTWFPLISITMPTIKIPENKTATNILITKLGKSYAWTQNWI